MRKWCCIALSLVVNALMWGSSTDSVLADTNFNDVSDSREMLMYDPAARLMGMDGVVSDVSSLDVPDVPETEEPEAEVFVETENYDLSTMKLKNSEIGVAEDGGTVENDLFDFEAFIKESDIKDGTAPFDSNNEAGNDSGEKNGVVRSFDSITYPIKITINPKKVDKLNNIVLKITGTLENGVTDGRVNAKFSVGGYEDLSTGKVGFERTYTIAQTGNSVMIPVSIDVMGAENNIDLKPEFKVQVISVDEKDITQDNVITSFDNLPKVTTSAKVSIGAKINHINGTTNYLSKYIKNTEDEYILNNAGLAFYAKNLSGKTDARGATLPTGKINFTIEVSGYVYWDKTKETKVLDFKNTDTPVRLFDLLEIRNSDTNRLGNKNTLMEDIKYYYGDGASGAPLSKMYSPEYHKKAVWDSGEYTLEKVNVDNQSISSIDGSISNYVIGSTFPVQYDYTPQGGGNNYGADQKVFSTRRIEVATPTEYSIGGKHNKQGDTNNVYYTLRVKINSYEDDNGNSHSINSVSNNYNYFQRNGIGNISSSLKFWSDSGKILGTSVTSNSYAPMGDESVLIGTSNVQSRFRLANGNAIMQGGATTIVKWNTDSFELERENANKQKLYFTYLQAKTKIWKTQSSGEVVIQYGVSKNTDMSFEKYLSYEKDDYSWFNTYDEAMKTGKVGAVLFDVKDEIETGPTILNGNVPLKVLSKDTVGSLNKIGTPNISTQLTYAYYDKDRKLETKLLDTRYKSYTTYDSNGAIIDLQKPVGGDVSLDTLGIINGNVSNSVKSNKETYYSSDTIGWNVKSSLEIPDTLSIDEFGGSVLIKQVLPSGLIYKVNSAMVGERQIEPKIVKNSNGTTSLTFELLPSVKGMTLDDIYYETTINPAGLVSKDGVQSSVTLKSVISSDIDQRDEKFRTSSQTINILKIGMVGIFENIDVDNGEKNSGFTVRMKPYTTIEDELDVKGLTVLPLNGDKLGSIYQGSAVLEGIEVTSKKPVSIYLNNSIVESNKPNQIDFTKNGWYKYTGKDQDISEALTLLFHVDGELSSTDDIEISFTVSTKDNNFGNIYYNETVINSATDYKLSPVSNKVRYTIRADVELNLERLQIYTAKSSEKLPVNLRVNKDIIKDRSLDEPLKLVLYDKEKNTKVYEKSLTIATLTRENELEVPAKYLEKNTNRTYEARIEGYNTDRIYVKKEADKIDTLGYTAMEGTIERDAATSDKLEFKGVLMAERELGKELDIYYEQFTMPLKKLSPVKAGYGFALDQTLTYTNDLSINNVSVPAFYTVVDSNVLDGRIASADDDTVVDLTSHPTYNGKTLTQSVSLPPVYVSQLDGAIFSEAEYNEAVTSTGAVGLIDGGNKLYTPIWISRLGGYDYAIKSKDPIGVNAVNIVVKDVVSVDAFMYDHIGSESAGKDELLIVPVIQDGEISGFDNLSDAEREWLDH